MTHVMSGQLEEITAQFSPQSRIRPSGGHISNQAVIITGTGLTKLSSAWERGGFYDLSFHKLQSMKGDISQILRTRRAFKEPND